MTSLFSAKLEDITFADIQQFCDQKFPEHISLDYKREISSKDPSEQISKIACALANTYGGLVLWGVPESKLPDGRGVPAALTGLPLTPSPADRLKKVCMDNIYPPLFPEIRDVPHHLDQTKVITLMRVTESDHTPHYIRSDGCIYVRGDDISKPINDGRIASPAEIEWLQRRRQKPADLRRELLETAETRALYQAGNNHSDLMSLSMIPLYPRTPLMTLQKLHSLHAPTDLLLTRQSATHSIFSFTVSSRPVDPLPWKYFEMNEFGMLYSASNATESTVVNRSINMISLLRRIVLMARYASDNYHALDYFGLIQVEAKLQAVRGYALTSSAHLNPQTEKMVDDKLTLRSIVSASELTNSAWIKSLHERYLWSLGRGVTLFANNEVQTDYDDVLKYGPAPNALWRTV